MGLGITELIGVTLLTLQTIDSGLTVDTSGDIPSIDGTEVGMRLSGNELSLVIGDALVSAQETLSPDDNPFSRLLEIVNNLISGAVNSFTSALDWLSDNTVGKFQNFIDIYLLTFGVEEIASAVLSLSSIETNFMKAYLAAIAIKIVSFPIMWLLTDISVQKTGVLQTIRI